MSCNVQRILLLLWTLSLTANEGLGLLHLQSLVDFRVSEGYNEFWSCLDESLVVSWIYSLHFNTYSIHVDNVHTLLCCLVI